jgi:Fe-S cluster assembly ATP-binding protein
MVSFTPLVKKQNRALQIAQLHVSVERKEILKGVSLTVKPGEFHVVMGPNGSGKSTLTYALMGHPSYEVTRGSVKIGTKSLLDLKADERAKLGVMLAFQNPLAIAGVTLSHFLRTAYRQLYGEKAKSVLELHKEMILHAKTLGLDESFLKRSLNDGFSGGEKKKAEMLQLLTLRPIFGIFDEIDTGLDVDALKTVAAGISALQSQRSGILLITHYQRILNYLSPTHVHVMMNGKFVKKGGPELVAQIEEKGYGYLHRTH